MMGHALSRKRGICIKQSKQGGASRIHKIRRLKHHARIGFIESANHWVCDWHARLEHSVQLIFILQFWNTTYHSIYWIGPEKIKDLISVHTWKSHDAKSWAADGKFIYRLIPYLLRTMFSKPRHYQATWRALRLLPWFEKKNVGYQLDYSGAENKNSQMI